MTSFMEFSCVSVAMDRRRCSIEVSALRARWTSGPCLVADAGAVEEGRLHGDGAQRGQELGAIALADLVPPAAVAAAGRMADDGDDGRPCCAPADVFNGAGDLRVQGCELTSAASTRSTDGALALEVEGVVVAAAHALVLVA